MKHAIELVRNVFPGFAGNNVMDRRAINAEFCRQSFHIPARPVCVALTDLFNLAFGQLGVPVLCAKHAPPLANHITHIVGVRSEKKMIGSNAKRNIAAVTNIKTFGDRPIMNQPREGVSGVRLRDRIARKFSGDSSISATCSGPKPARLRFTYSIPKTLKNRDVFGVPVAPFAAKLLASPAPNSLKAGKGITAIGAYQNDGFCDTMISGHGVTSETGCKVSRLVRALQRSFGPFAFYHQMGRYDS